MRDASDERALGDVATRKRTLPALIGVRPATALISVDLPAPFGPEHRDDLASRHRNRGAVDDRQAGFVAGDEFVDDEDRRLRSCRGAAEIGFDHARIADDSARASFAEQLARRHHEDAPAQPRDHVHVVLDHEHARRRAG